MKERGSDARETPLRALRAALDTLAGRTIVVVLFGIALVHLVSLLSYNHALKREVELSNVARLADRLLAIKRAVMRVAPDERENVAHDLSGGPIEAHWSRTEHAVPGGPGADAWEGLGARLLGLAPELAGDGLVIGANRSVPDDPHLALISMRLPDASWVNVSLVSWRIPGPDGHGALLSTSLMALGAVFVSVLMVRWLTRPLSTFAEAAKRFYRSPESALVPERGPREIRELATAFNEMQRRIAGLVEARTLALAAVSHDLKTPITRLRLRVESVDDPSVSASIVADLDEMERMLDQTLAYLRGDRADEDVKPVDLVAILETIADDMTDAGARVELGGDASVVLAGRRLALKRAFSNLIENAVKYGGRARVTLTGAARTIVVTIADDGPGIAPENRERALAPFVRLEPSRSHETGGFGLGLTISKAIIEGHDGTLSLDNGAAGGLVVTIRLPRGGPRGDRVADGDARAIPLGS